MLSISNCSAAMAQNYYQKDNYYAKTLDAKTDQWQGDLCKDLGLKDGQIVDGSEFEAMLQTSGKTVASYDLTFSAPKSVSIASELGNQLIREDMLQAHREAVSEVVSEIERNEIGCRVQVDGVRQHVHTGRASVAKFEHCVSRAEDPQLHTHTVWLNSTEHNGEAVAIDGKPLYATKMRYGAEYRARIASKLRVKGYEIVITDAKKGLWELKGIKPEVIKEFSKRREDIKAAAKEAGLNPQNAEAMADLTLNTRNVKRNTDISVKREEWRAKLDELGQDVPERGQAVDERQLVKEREAAYKSAVSELEQKQFAWTQKDFETTVINHGVAAGMTRAEAQAFINADKSLISMNPKRGSGLAAEKYYTTADNLRIEREIMERIVNTDGRFRGAAQGDAAQALEKIEKENNWNLARDGITEQRDMCMHIATNPGNHQFTAVIGRAGTGKTFTTGAAVQLLQRLEPNIKIRGAAATGAAAQELSEDAKIKECHTIHHVLNEAEKEAGNAVPGEDLSQKRNWNLEGLKMSEKPTVWFVDETSLVDSRLFHKFQEMIVRRGDRCIFLGDPQQMQAVGGGAPYERITELVNGRPAADTLYLSNIQRQRENRQLLEAVRQAVGGKTKVSLNIISKDIKEIKGHKARLKAVAKAYTDLSPEEQAKTRVLTARNADRVIINDTIRKTLVKRGQIAQGEQYTVQPRQDEPMQQRFFAKGEKIVFLRNDGRLGGDGKGVRNGMTGTVSDINGDQFTVQIGKERQISFDIKEYNAIDYAMCQTPNKAQGQTHQRAIVHLSSEDKALNSKNAYYVDISRAKTDVKLFVDDRGKLEPQISKFAKKISSKDFKWNAETGKFSKAKSNLNMGSRGSKFGRTLVQGMEKTAIVAGKAARVLTVGLKTLGKAASFIPIVGKPIEFISRAPDAALKTAINIASTGKAVANSSMSVVSAGKKTAVGLIKTTGGIAKEGAQMSLSTAQSVVNTAKKGRHRRQ